jgi:hypothetical protein
MKQFTVSVGVDHIEALARSRNPVLAVAEHIWNALDADAKTIMITLIPNDFGGLDSIQVQDDGDGIRPEDLEMAFGRLGDSWKKTAERTKGLGRALHGKKGVGRYRALALGGKSIWDTRFEENGQLFGYQISFDDGDKRKVNSTEPTVSPGHKGTTVTIFDPTTKLGTLEIESVKPQLTECFALYLRQYPDINLTYDGMRIVPDDLIANSVDINFDFVTEDNVLSPQTLTIIEWKAPLERALFLCSREGFSFREVPAGVQAPGLKFTAYLRSALLEELESRDAIDVELGDLGKLLEVTREKLREYVSRRQAEQTAALVEEWKQECIYPYEGTAQDDVEQAKRQVFDVVAENVTRYLPEFKNSKKKSKQLTFNLLRYAIESSPSSLKKILKEVIGLPKEKQEELAVLLDKSSLSAIINASKVVADRLEFIQGLRSMLYDSPYRNKLLERKQLQRLVADNTWLFGDEYFLMNDDESLTNVLKKHLDRRGYFVDEGLVDFFEDVTFEDGGTGIVDLAITSEPLSEVTDPGTVIGKTLARAGTDPVHNLIIELKRPTQKVTPAVLAEVRDYAYAIARDERFHGIPAKWTFWALSNQISDQAQQEATQMNLPPGVVFQSGIIAGKNFEYTIIAKTWAQVLDQASQRLEFFRKHLSYSPSFSQGRNFLNAVYRKYIPTEAQNMPEEATAKTAAAGLGVRRS